jgi:hypothetical protein
MNHQNSAVHKDVDTVVDVPERSHMGTRNNIEKVKSFNSRGVVKVVRCLIAELQVAY